jgi:hypothetical protein
LLGKLPIGTLQLAKELEVRAVADLVVCATTRSSRRENGYFAGISGQNRVWRPQRIGGFRVR